MSVALVTRNRPESLERTLEAIVKQTQSPFEIVLSDDSDSQSAITKNKQLAIKYGAKYLGGPRRGLYANRNFAAKNCNGTHIRTMDDDHEFPADHFEKCLMAIFEDPESVWFIGEFYPGECVTDFPPCPGQIHPRGFSVSPPNDQDCYSIACGASIYPRQIIDKNLLNVEFYKFGIVYLEYGSRLYKYGYKMRFLQNTYIIHHMDSHSFNDKVLITEARIFTMIAYSFFCSPSIKNKVKTLLEIIKILFLEIKPSDWLKMSYSLYNNIKIYKLMLTKAI